RELPAKQFASSLAALEELETLTDLTPEERFQQAQCLTALDRMDEARPLVQSLAESPNPVYAQALRWLLNDLAQRSDGNIQGPALTEYETLLKALVQYAPKDEEAQRMMSTLYAQTGRMNQSLLL